MVLYKEERLSVSESIPASIKSWVSARGLLAHVVYWVGEWVAKLCAICTCWLAWKPYVCCPTRSLCQVSYVLCRYSLPPPPPHWGPCVCCLFPPPCQGLCFIQGPTTTLWAFYYYLGGKGGKAWKNKGMKIVEQGVCHLTVTLPFTLTSILRQKKNYGKFKYFTMQKYNLSKKKALQKKPNSFKIS